MKLSPKPETMAFAGGYLSLCAIFLLAFASARAAGDWQLNLQSGVMRVCMAIALVSVMAAIGLLAMAYRRSGTQRRSQLWLPLAMTVVTGLVMTAVAEVGLRLIDQPDPLGRRIGHTVLIPYEWPAFVEFNKGLLQRSPPASAYYVEDRTLGWTVGPSRSSEDGLYLSSEEGLRSAHLGEQLEGLRAGDTVALFGNSFAFSEEVAFADSLGARLEELIPARVLNFGVPGFGVDQAALRFEHEGAQWAPRVAVLAFIEDDLRRTANIYAFLKVSWGLPLSKPRFVMDGGELALRNSPTLDSERIFAEESIFELPLLEYDSEFLPQRWRWHPLHNSYLLRFLISKMPVWPPTRAEVSNDAIVSVSSQLISGFVERSRTSGITPVIVYLPTDADINPNGRHPLKQQLIRVLASSGIIVADMTQCLGSQVPRPELFMPGGHYTRKGNEVLAECLKPHLLSALQSPSSRPGIEAQASVR